MPSDGVVAEELARSSRRRFLVKTLGIAAGFLLPAALVDAAARDRTARRAGSRKRRKHARLGPGKIRGGALAQPAPELMARCMTTRHRSLALYNLHTGERCAADYVTHGQYDRECLKTISWVLRDYRTDEVHAIDPGVLDLLFAIRAQLETDDELHIVSGYRSPLTNWTKYLTEPGVARHSYHVAGRAIDFYVPHRRLRDVQRVALALGGGGVGYYPRSGFVHVDNGPVRYW
jgi:uncharacterized protein YcbK (DUF882 family)